MNPLSTRNWRSAARSLGGLVTALALTGALSGAVLSGCSDDDPVVATTSGALNLAIDSGAAVITVTGPSGYTQTFSGNRLLLDLAPGQYSAVATALGFRDSSGETNVVAGYTSGITLRMESSALSTTVGSLNVNVNPAAATVIVTGPTGYSETFIGNQFLTGLAPGQYSAFASAPGFGSSSSAVNVVVGLTSSLSITLQPVPFVVEAPRAVYRDGSGHLIPIDATSLQSGKFVFYAWLQDRPLGIDTAKLVATTNSDPGAPLLTEQDESAPSYTQNLAAGWVGYTDSAGVVHPVIGADVRWEIDPWWEGRVNSTQFGTSDDNRQALGYGVFDDQADTRTNNAALSNSGFPLVASQFPLYNVSGVNSPYVDGFTWVTLFSPDARALSRIVVVATINGEEIGKQILYKTFAPTPILRIFKTVNKDVVNLVGGEASVTWTVRVDNIGTGGATAVDLRDLLSRGGPTFYAIDAPPTGATASGNDGFTLTFPLAAGATKTVTFAAKVTAAGTYCNEAAILAYEDADNSWTPTGLDAEACFTALESNVSIVKDFVADDLVTSLGKTRTVAASAPVKLRVRVFNAGSGNATGVVVADALTSGVSANYTVASVAPGTLNGNDGFDTTVGNLAAGATSTIILTVSASLDGIYCDTATVTATSGEIGIGSDTACLTVATPVLTITKVNAPDSVIPGATYVSTIVVTNTGNATANDVVIRDTLGLQASTNARATYVSSSLNGIAGTLANSVVTANTINIAAGESVTFTVVSRIPPASASTEYCNTAKATSGNAAPVEASDCVAVPAFSALQTQCVDLNDPVAVGDEAAYFSVIYVEPHSNEGVHSNALVFSFGLADPEDIGSAGLFRVVTTRVYLDSHPVRDPGTGLVISDTSSPTAMLQTLGTHYTLSDATEGRQTLTITPSFVLTPNTAFYFVHVVTVPSDVPANAQYTSGFEWDAIGAVDATHTYKSRGSEPTTVLP